MNRIELLQKAKILRKSGLSYKAIANELNLSPSTTHLWLKEVPLDEKAIKRLQASKFAGMRKGWETNRMKKVNRNSQISFSVQKAISIAKFDQLSIKLFCALLYWGEGQKYGSTINFTNSDPVMVKLFLNLFKKSFNVPASIWKAFLHLHGYHSRKKQVDFWSRITGIPKKNIFIYNKPYSGKNVRKNYPGCISIRYNDITIRKEIEYLYKSLAISLGA
jgi:hypothetical protein